MVLLLGLAPAAWSAPPPPPATAEEQLAAEKKKLEEAEAEARKAQEALLAAKDALEKAAAQETAAAKAEATAAKDEASKAKEGTAAAKEEAAKAKKDAENAKGAAQARRLIRYGVSAGVAATVLVPLPGTNTLQEPAAAAMPYTILVPAFWGNNSRRNAYCAAIWSGPEENAIRAQEAETEGAERPQNYQKDRNELDALYDRQASLFGEHGRNEEALRLSSSAIAKACPGSAPTLITLPDDTKSRLETMCPGADKALLITELETDRLARKGTQAALSSIAADIRAKAESLDDRKCGLYKFGAYVGYPSTIGATSEVARGTAQSVARRDYAPVISFGLAIVPNAIVTAIIGPTVGTAQRDDGSSAVIWTLSAGLGLNLDLVNALP